MTKLEQIARKHVEAAWPYHPTERHVLAALHELREELAQWYYKVGFYLDEDAVPDAIRRYGEEP